MMYFEDNAFVWDNNLTDDGLRRSRNQKEFVGRHVADLNGPISILRSFALAFHNQGLCVRRFRAAQGFQIFREYLID